MPKAFQRVQGLALRLGGFLKSSSDCSHGLLWSAIKGCRNRKGIVCIFQSRTCSENHLRSFSINISVVMEEAVNPRLHLVQQRHFFPCGITAGKGTLSSFVWGNCSSVWNQWTQVFWERRRCSLGIGVVDYYCSEWIIPCSFLPSVGNIIIQPVPCVQMMTVTLIRLWASSFVWDLWPSLIVRPD